MDTLSVDPRRLGLCSTHLTAVLWRCLFMGAPVKFISRIQSLYGHSRPRSRLQLSFIRVHQGGGVCQGSLLTFFQFCRFKDSGSDIRSQSLAEL